MKYRLSDLLPVIKETLLSGGEFTLPVTGTSMLPLLVQGRDSVVLGKAHAKLKKGDLPLYRRADGSFVLHRVIGSDKNGYIMCGDNQFDPEYNITDDNVIGLVTKIKRKNKEFSAESALYRLYVSVWTGLLKVRYPLRRLRRSAKKTDEIAVGTAESFNPKPCVPYLLALLKCALDNTTPPPVPQDVELENVLKLAVQHKVANMAAYSVSRLTDVNPEITQLFRKELFRVVQRREAQKNALSEIEEQLAAKGIKYCILKGDALAKLYPDANMRFSLDMDIYVSPENVPVAEKIMCGLGYSQEGEKTTKDIAFTKKPNLTVEIHFDLNFETDLTHDYFTGLISRLRVCPDSPYKLKMSDEDLFIYILGHTAHHFLVSGTGIRSILDYYILRTKLLPNCDVSYINTQLEAAGLKEFAGHISELSEYWFNKGPCTDIVKRLERYVIESGVFGTESLFYVNSAVPQSNIGGSRAKYVIERIFPSYTFMKVLFPVLRQRPFLMPFCWFLRWFKVIGNMGRISGEIAGVAGVEKEKVKDRSDLFGKMGFK